MNPTSGISVHYYLKDGKHLIDSNLRNKREAELLALYHQAALIFRVDLNVYTMPPENGGFIEAWQMLADHNAAITSCSAIVAALSIFISHVPKTDRLKNQQTQLDIEKKRLEIEKLRKELHKPTELLTQETIEAVCEILSTDNKSVIRRSNFYKNLAIHPDVTTVGIANIGDDGKPIEEETTITRNLFPRFVLKTNKLPPIIDERAIIEIIAPVVGEGPYKWKGIYQEQPINFAMLDQDFRAAVLNEGVPFKHGTVIECELNIFRKLDEAGEEVITGHTVSVILGIGEGINIEETQQGNEHKQARVEEKTQRDIFNQEDK